MPDTEHIEQEFPHKITGLFPLSSIKNIKLFYLLTATSSAWFIAGNWIFFWTRYMTYGELGLVDASAFAFGLIMEIPSGAISDMIGKKITLVVAMILTSSSIIAMALTNTLLQLWIAFFVTQLGWALYSGAAEALAYDTLVDNKKEDKYENVISSSGTVASMVSVTATLMGGLLYALHFRLSHLAWGITNLLGVFVALKMTEPSTDTVRFSFRSWYQQLKDGTKQMVKPSLRPFLVIILAFLGAGYLYNYGLVKPAIAIGFGFFDKEQAVIFASFGIIGALVVRIIPRFRKIISDKKGLYLLALFMGSGFIIASLNIGYWGLISMLLIGLSGRLAYPWVSIVINKEISSKYRATTLSTAALITKLPYVALAVIAGNMVEAETFNVFNLAVGAVIIISILLSSVSFVTSKLKRVDT